MAHPSGWLDGWQGWAWQSTHAHTHTHTLAGANAQSLNPKEEFDEAGAVLESRVQQEGTLSRSPTNPRLLDLHLRSGTEPKLPVEVSRMK